MAGVQDRIALVTGAGRGIGRSTAELLASRGARVMAVSRSEQELAALGLEYAVADLGTPEGCALAVAETERRLGPIEILICNHGIGSAHERVIWEQDPKVWSETMQINLDGPFHLSQLVVRGMVERGYGRIVYTSSTAGRLHGRQARTDRLDARGRTGRRPARRHLECGAARLGADRDGRALGTRRSERARHHPRADLGGAGG